MIPPKLSLLALLFVATLAHAKEPVAAARDDAGQSAYSGGWNETGGGSGFGDWKFQQLSVANDTYAGHFLAAGSENPEKSSVATDGRAFGLFANGYGFEASVAFRPLSTALKSGDTFSFQMVNLLIEQKGAADSPAAGAIGLTLRNGNAGDSPDDYNKGSRFEVINLKGLATYQVYDGEQSHDTGVTYSEQGITVTVTLTGADSYDLEITRLADKTTTKLHGRKLAGSGPVESFCIFNRNGEKADGFFNNFAVSGSGK